MSAEPLSYPLGRGPAPGEDVRAAPGALWLRMPLPMALIHMTVRVLADGDGRTLVDMGMQTHETQAARQNGSSDVLGGCPVTHAPCTQRHRDPNGAAWRAGTACYRPA